MNLERYLVGLAQSDKLVSYSGLINLSSLEPRELTIFKRTWATLEVGRRRQIIGQLDQLAEDNFELDFSDIFRVCLEDPDEEVRERAIEGLWECEERSLIAPLISLLQQDSTERVRAAAATGLGRFALLAELGKLLPQDLKRLAGCLLAVIRGEGEVIGVRRRAIEAIAPLNLPEVREIIGETYLGNDPDLKVSALYAMGRNCDPQWLPILLKELSSPLPEVRFESAGACGELGDERAVPYLVSLLSDVDSQVQLAAVEALGSIGGSAAREALSRCLDSPEDRIREAAERALENLEPGEELQGFDGSFSP